MKIKFFKYHGLGNSYIFIDGNKYKLNYSDLSKFVSDPSFGIGSDGLIVITKIDNENFFMNIFNKDGSEAEMCGNGLRCAAVYIYDNKFINKLSFDINTLAGKKNVYLIKSKLNSKIIDSVKINLGKPLWKRKDLQMLGDENEEALNINIKKFNRNFILNCVSFGNPHAVIIMDNLNFDLKKYGGFIENYELFKNKVNVEFVKIKDRNNIIVKVWERGSGETFACGTGAGASVAVLNRLNLVNDKVNVEMKGGLLIIEKNCEENYYLTGPVKLSCYGYFNYK